MRLSMPCPQPPLGAVFGAGCVLLQEPLHPQLSSEPGMLGGSRGLSPLPDLRDAPGRCSPASVTSLPSHSTQCSVRQRAAPEEEKPPCKDLSWRGLSGAGMGGPQRRSFPASATPHQHAPGLSGGAAPAGDRFMQDELYKPCRTGVSGNETLVKSCTDLCQCPNRTRQLGSAAGWR